MEMNRQSVLKQLHHRLRLAAVIALAFFMTGCQSTPAVNGDVPQPNGRDSLPSRTVADDSEFHSSDSSFARYLRFFSDVRPLDQWPEEALDQLVLHGEIWKEDKTELKFVLENYYHKIDPILWRHIPGRKLKSLAKEGRSIPDPLSRYDFYAFAKVKQDENWLVSMLALKREMEQDVYHQHPFLLVTYSPDSVLLDDYIWWVIADDDIQVCDDVDVSGDTLLVGKKEDIHRMGLDVVYEKVVVTKTGKFNPVYQNFPEGYITK